jgi:hypothetical protein
MDPDPDRKPSSHRSWSDKSSGSRSTRLSKTEEICKDEYIFSFRQSSTVARGLNGVESSISISGDWMPHAVLETCINLKTLRHVVALISSIEAWITNQSWRTFSILLFGPYFTYNINQRLPCKFFCIILRKLKYPDQTFKSSLPEYRFFLYTAIFFYS